MWSYQEIARKARDNANLAVLRDSPAEAREWLEVALLAEAAERNPVALARAMVSAEEVVDAARS